MAMRLTLRTLLAYLDRILEPADAQEMAKKIEESRAAAELMNRIRDVTKKVRLGAPPLEGKGLGLDANTVAEYLDNTMPGEAVSDFEMVCLESDVHLAEVAACHEVLSLVLVKAAEIDPNARRRMYGLPVSEAESAIRADAPVTATPVATPIASVAPAEPARRFEVPDYLRQGADQLPARKRSGALAAAVALLALVLAGGGAALALIPRSSLPVALHPVADLLFPQSGPTVAVDEPAEEPTTNDSPLAGPSGNTTTSSAAAAGSMTTAAAGTPPGGGVATIGEPAPGAVGAVGGSLVGAGSASPSGASLAQTSVSGAVMASATGLSTQGLRQPQTALIPSAATPAPPAGGATGMVPPVPAGAVLPAASASGTSMTAVASNVGPTLPTATSGANPTAGVASPSGAAASPGVGQPPKVEPIGRVTSATTEAMLRFDPRTAGWVRLSGRETLLVGDRLLALPGFRPQVALANGVSFDMLGGTQIDLLPVDATGTPGLRIARGRIMLFTVAGAKPKLALTAGGVQGVCSLSAAELGVEHQFRRPDGYDPTTVEVPAVLNLYVKSGEVDWSAPATTRFPAGSQWSIAPSSPPAKIAADSPPRWLLEDERDALERQAAAIVGEGLAGDKAVTVALKEAAEHRRIEVAQLALRGLAQVGEYEAFTSPLRDATQRSSTWDRYLEWLTAALNYGPYYCEKVREALTKQHGVDKGGVLFRMLWGFDDAQLQNGAAKDLVEMLDHSELDFRIVAGWNLVRISGQSLGYAPQDPPLKRKQAIVKWEQKLAAGQIVRGKMP